MCAYTFCGGALPALAAAARGAAVAPSVVRVPVVGDPAGVHPSSSQDPQVRAAAMVPIARLRGSMAAAGPPVWSPTP
jgi:hypothetical protein